MGHEQKEPLDAERLVFFSDAVVAIAITLLALDLRLEHAHDPITFGDIGGMWRKWAAFILSFVLIGTFWKVHHQFFRHIRHTDGMLMNHNLLWLLFIVTLPFSTTLVSDGFDQQVPMFVYSMNTFLLTTFQNNIWDHACVRPHLMHQGVSAELVREYRIACNVAVVNSVLAVALSMFLPLVAFLVLFTRPLMIAAATRYYLRRGARK